MPLRSQIPAFLCRQTDLIVAAAKTGAIIQIKKGQFCAASVMRNSAEKCRAAGKTYCSLISRHAASCCPVLVCSGTSSKDISPDRAHLLYACACNLCAHCEYGFDNVLMAAYNQV